MSAHGLDLERPYREQDPLDMDDARLASRRVSRLRRDAEAQLVKRAREKGEKESEYRRLRSIAITEARADGPATTAKEMADGDAEVRRALIEWKVAEGMYDAARERVKGVEGERSMLKSLIDWSSTITNVLRQSGGMKHEPDGDAGREERATK